MKPDKKKMSKKKKIILIVLAVLLVLLLAAGLTVYGVIHGFYHASNYTPDEDAMKGYEEPKDPDDQADLVDPDNSNGQKLTDEELAALDERLADYYNAEPITNDGNVYNVLLIGVDRRDRSWAGNSDTMILMSVNYDKKQISMISLMRDTYVNIPGIGMRKLNAAHANGAGPLLVKTVTQNYKIQVDRYASVDFESMTDIVDKMGGIELTFSEKEAESANGNIREMCDLRGWNAEDYMLPGGGTHQCSGIQAVAYARIRHVGHADYQRTERQRTVLTKIIEKLKILSVTELYDYAQAVLPLVTHNIPENEMWTMLAKAPSLFQYDLVKDRIPYDNMYDVIYVRRQDMLVPDWEATIRKLKDTLY